MNQSRTLIAHPSLTFKQSNVTGLEILDICLSLEQSRRPGRDSLVQDAVTPADLFSKSFKDFSPRELFPSVINCAEGPRRKIGELICEQNF